MAPEEALSELLQVPLGCVTPFALVNESARHVSLLLDQGFKTKEFCFFHPLSNDMSISLNARDLDKFLKAIGREPSYVDLEANPSVGKDQPPDLADLVPSGSTVLPDAPEKAGSSQGPTENHVFADNKATGVTGTAKVVKLSNNVKNKLANADVEQFVNEIMAKTSNLVLSEITEETIQQQGEKLGTMVADNIRKRLSAEFKNLAIMFKNSAYTEGFYAGTQLKRT